jgi:cell division protein FtsB
MSDAQLPERPEGESAPRPNGPRVRRRVRPTTADKQKRKKLWTYGLLLLSAALMVNALIGEKGYLANLQAKQEYQDASQSVEQLKAENARLTEEARRLQSDPRALEDAARSQLGLIKPGETLITLRDRASRD